VNFNVSIDADSKVVLFGEAAPTMTNVIVAEHVLPVTALYDASGTVGLIEIWEPSNAQGNIRCQLANDGGDASGAPVFLGAYKESARRLARGIQRLLCDAFDCSGATPFNAYTEEEYYKQRDFGRVALGAFAHYLFGHVDATAAITNDVAFVQNMLSVTAAGGNEDASGAALRYAAWSKDVSGDVGTWNFTSTNLDANLALRLVKEIVAKGFSVPADLSGSLVTSDISGGTAPAASLAEIVKQVIGQDSSRVQDVDGSERTLDKHLLLRFYAGDVIYLKINVKKPTVEVTGVGTANGPANTLVQESETAYTLKITLA
jgi:hypothetical protein